jgi:uncharacterized phage infection (PIP) family protein YhgE
MLAETRAELDEFHHSSKELEEELIRELERTEKAQQDLKVKVAKAESDRDEWKVCHSALSSSGRLMSGFARLQTKFMALQTTHNTTTATLQRELDKLRQEHQSIKIQLRELEMGNDDLERNERAVSSSLADVEAKYSRALEEKILLEHELLDKANLEEESQRLKDELRGEIGLRPCDNDLKSCRCQRGDFHTQRPVGRPFECIFYRGDTTTAIATGNASVSPDCPIF